MHRSEAVPDGPEPRRAARRTAKISVLLGRQNKNTLHQRPLPSGCKEKLMTTLRVDGKAINVLTVARSGSNILDVLCRHSLDLAGLDLISGEKHNWELQIDGDPTTILFEGEIVAMGKDTDETFNLEILVHGGI